MSHRTAPHSHGHDDSDGRPPGDEHGHDHPHGHDHGTGLGARLRHGLSEMFGAHSHDPADQVDAALEADRAGPAR
ncbi:MAG TPA: hypothetical protein VGH43_12065 [Jatrophihabitans sp.]|jgi:hypothetical protein